MDDLLNEFLTETSESIAVLDVELVNLEQNPDNPGLIDNIFRLVHTIKGTCGFLGLPRLETIAHASENVLGKFRDGALVVTPAAVTLILASLDSIKSILAALEATEKEPSGDDAALIAKLNALGSGEDAAEPPADDPSLAFFEPVPAALTAVPVAAVPAAPVAVVPVPHGEAGRGEDARGHSENSIANQTIRVNVELLENLMTMVSELVLSRNQLLQMVRNLNDSEFAVPLQRLSHVTTELQEGVMKTRMQPIGNAWAKLPRIIRDLSIELGKKIDLQMVGAETELDRQVLELIKDPLTHMVRNSADHGLEQPRERLAAGKPEVGRIMLNAYHEGGHIIIEIKDDGRGLHSARIRAKAIEKGMVSEAEADGLSDQQILQFIFRPGFSTAEAVTAVSGRGVGMDVVRTNIEKIGGNIELKSVEGKGTTFTIKIPLTLAIVSALIVECAGERFAIPQISVVELVRAATNSEHRIERINDTPVLRLRNRLLPLIFLADTLKLDPVAGDNRVVGEETFIVVTQVGTYSFGIVVDRVFDTEEIVVKPVAPILRNIPMFSGNTILGDGSVIMILDPNGIAGEAGEKTLADHVTDDHRRHEARAEDLTTLLVFRAGGEQPKAVPLSLVARLEEIDVGQIEFANGQHLVQYRGRLMPLVRIDDSYAFKTEGRQPIIVFADGDHSMGLAVDEIVDIVEDRLEVQLSGHSDSMIGSAVIDGHATEVINVAHYLGRTSPAWFGSSSGGSGKPAAQRRVLLVDDSPFFRNMLAPLLAVAGYAVTTAEDAAQALKLRDDGEGFDVIISDIEMPGMSGFEFAEAVKQDVRWQDTPLVALSSHASQGDFIRGREVGFSDYVAKFDRDALLQSLSETLITAGAA